MDEDKSDTRENEREGKRYLSLLSLFLGDSKKQSGWNYRGPDLPIYYQRSLEDYITIFKNPELAKVIFNYVQKNKDRKEWIIVSGRELGNYTDILVRQGYFVESKDERGRYVLSEYSVELMNEAFGD